ncbi:MAG: CCA tRNA nucleotidyltransferase, partial [Gemmatimonadota bacterium]
MSSLAAPPAVRWVVRTLEDAGFETWAVGGAVRDLLTGLDSVDWDFATRARPAEVRRVFRRTVPIGIEHGTVGVLSRDGTLFEVTTFRKDVETFGRHAVVEFAERLEDDLARRDFTINAVAWHPLRDEVRDPHGGLDDLEAGVLRTVGRPRDRFAEDYLRVLRALRFAGRYDLTVDEATWTALAVAVDHLPRLSPERVREELVKVLQKDGRPSRALGLYAASGALAVVYPELAGTPGRPGRAEGEPDGWSRTLLAVDRIPRRRSLLRLAALLLDAGGPEGDPPRAAFALLTRLRFSNADIDRVVGVVRTAAAGLPSPDADGPTVRRWLAASGLERVPDVVRLLGARARVEDAVTERAERPEDVSGRQARAVASSARTLRAAIRRLPPLAVGDLALDGRDLIRMGLKPGPRFGQILDALL